MTMSSFLREKSQADSWEYILYATRLTKHKFYCKAKENRFK